VEVVILMSDATTVSSGLGRRRWLVLGVIGIAQLMVVLDLTIMNIKPRQAPAVRHDPMTSDFAGEGLRQGGAEVPLDPDRVRGRSWVHEAMVRVGR
jgi:hypothetical protein